MIAFREPSIPGLPPENRNFGSTGGVALKIVVVGLITGDAPSRLDRFFSGEPIEATVGTNLRFKPLVYTSLSFLDGVLEMVELWVEAPTLSEGGGGAALVESPKDDGFRLRGLRYPDYLLS